MSEMLYYYLLGALMMLSLLGLWFAFIMPGLDGWSRRFFKLLFLALALCMLVYLIDVAVCEPSGSIPAIKIIWLLESLLLSVPMFMMTLYLVHCCGENIRKSRLVRAADGLWLVFFVLNLIAPFTPSLYDIGPDAQFIRGPWYPLGIFPMIMLMILNFQAVVRRRSQLSGNTYIAFMVYLIPLTAALIIHAIVSSYLLVDIGVSISSFGMFCIIVFDQIEQYMRQQREIAHQRASILVLEMRPHFIYNTMTSIYYLIDLDPKKAKQVTMDFTTYLRKNFTAVASENTIPFSEELEHTRAYLAVEQAQYDDRLFVDYDTAYTQFRLPPLTLQPIVENAVKHGMDPDAEPLRITIRTRQTPSGSEILVTDDGVGFESADSGGPHIALKNIRQRLEMMCGGSLTITSRGGSGTTVTVTIPDKAAG